jgi:hypothetical protein
MMGQPVSILIIEGVTGAGKSSTISSLQKIATFHLVDEDATFDDFLSEFFADPDGAAHKARDRMMRILDDITSDDLGHVVLERFHFSMLALGSGWNWYREIDERCAAFNCKVINMVLPPELIARRALRRDEYGGEDWQNLILYYASEERALSVLRQAQRLRIEALGESRLESKSIETGQKAWDVYAHEIVSWLGWPTRDNSTHR